MADSYTSPATEPETDTEVGPPPSRRRGIVILVIVAVVLIAVGFWWHSTYYEDTDDAQIYAPLCRQSWRCVACDGDLACEMQLRSSAFQVGGLECYDRVGVIHEYRFGNREPQLLVTRLQHRN